MSSRSARRRVRRGEWDEVERGVYAGAAAVLTFSGRVAAVAEALAGCDFAFTGRTAAALLGVLTPADADTIEVAIPWERRFTPLSSHVRVRRVDPAILQRRRVRHGVPVLDLETTVLHCASHLAEDELYDLVERVLRERRSTLERLRGRLRRGVPGSARLRRLLDLLSDGHGSRWNRRLATLMVQRGLPRPKPEFPVILDGKRHWLDLVDEEAGVAIEVDDWLTHAQRQRFAADRRRQRRAYAELGYIVVPIAVSEVQRDEAAVLDDLEAIYARARQQRVAATA